MIESIIVALNLLASLLLAIPGAPAAPETPAQAPPACAVPCAPSTVPMQEIHEP